MDRADVVLIMFALVGTHAFPVIFLFTRVLGLVACFRELLTGTGEMIVRAGAIPLQVKPDAIGDKGPFWRTSVTPSRNSIAMKA